MNNLANKITAYLGSKPDFTEEVLLQDDMVNIQRNKLCLLLY
jgi:hypothetical protein